MEGGRHLERKTWKGDVLIVESNAVTRKIIRSTLDQEGYRVREAADRRAAMRCASEATPDLILLSLRLPDRDGLALAKEIRAIPRLASTHILAISAGAPSAGSAHRLSPEFDDVIGKPIEPSQLLRIVRGHLAARHDDVAPFGEGRTLVVADDEPVQLELATFHLERLGFRVVGATNGQAALELARRERPAAIVTDVMMPVLDGFALCAAVRRDSELGTTPLLLVTAGPVHIANRELALLLGAVDLVTRTPDFGAVIAAVRRGLGREQVAGDATLTPTAGSTVARNDEQASRSEGQLERQVALNARLVGRCVLQKAELAILGGIADTLARKQSFWVALDELLASCLNAAGIARGALYLLEPGAGIEARPLGAMSGDLETFFGEPELLRSIISAGVAVELPSRELGDERTRRLLARAQVPAALVAPLVHGSTALGALLIVSEQRGVDEERKLFAQGVANQLALMLMLTHVFQRLEASVHLRDDFLAVAAHELRSPLGPLRTSARRLGRIIREHGMESLSAAELVDRLDEIEHAVARVGRLTDRLHDVSRIASERMQLHCGALDLVDAAHAVVRGLELEAARARCRVSVQAGGPVIGRWDRLRVEQAIENLLVNALQWGAGGPIVITVGQDGEFARLSVQDLGVGIELGDQEVIFERFTRLRSGPSSGGFGLGLWMAREIADAHGGSIAVASEPTRGARFTMVLPRQGATGRSQVMELGS